MNSELGPSWGYLKAILVILKLSCGLVGAILCQLESLGSHLGGLLAFLGLSWLNLGQLEVMLGPSRPPFQVEAVFVSHFLDRLGATSEPSWDYLEVILGGLGQSWSLLGLQRAILGLSADPLGLAGV